MRKLQFLLTLFMLASPLVAQADEDKRRPPKPKPDCLDGTFYDDGKFESGLAPNVLLFRDDFVMLFEAPSYPALLKKVCVGFVRTGFDTTIFFDLHIWSADGPDGSPGTLLFEVPTLGGGGVPLRKPRFYDFDISEAGIVIDGPVYIGPSWDPLNPFEVYLGMDNGPKTPRRRAFYGTGILNDHAPDQEMGLVGQVPQCRALAIRAVFGTVP